MLRASNWELCHVTHCPTDLHGGKSTQRGDREGGTDAHLEPSKDAQDEDLDGRLEDRRHTHLLSDHHAVFH